MRVAALIHWCQACVSTAHGFMRVAAGMHPFAAAAAAAGCFHGPTVCVCVHGTATWG